MQAMMDQGHVYIFFGKNRKRIKALFYDGTGLVLISKRMEKGNFIAPILLLVWSILLITLTEQSYQKVLRII